MALLLRALASHQQRLLVNRVRKSEKAITGVANSG
jgi:hypothetical protein